MKTTSKAVPFEKIFPVMNIIDGLVISKKGIITFGMELTLPVNFTQNEGNYDAMISAFASAARTLPPWTVVHKQDIYLYEKYDASGRKKGSFLGDNYWDKYEGRKYLTHHSYLFLSLGKRGLIEKNDVDSGLFGLGKPVPVPSEETLHGFLSKCEEFISIFSASGIGISKLTQRDWLGTDEGEGGIIEQYMMLGNRSPVYSDIAFTSESVSVYDKTAVCFSIGETANLPNYLSSVSRVEALSGARNDVFLSLASQIGSLLNCEHVVNHIMVIPQQADMLQKIEAGRKKMISGFDDNENRMNAEEIEMFQTETYKDGLFLVQGHVNVLLWGRDDEQMDLMGKVNAAFTRMNSYATFNRYNTPSVFYAGIPSNAYEIGQDNLVPMEIKSFLCLTPYETFDQDQPDGCLTLCDRSRFIPISIDLQRLAMKMGWTTNSNGIIYGASGTGKSFYTNLFVRNCYDHGQDIFIIDVGDSYEGQCNIVNEITNRKDGLYFTWDIDHPFSFNPFVGWDGWLSESGALKPEENGVNFVMAFMQMVWEPTGGWTSEHMPILRRILIDFLADWKSQHGKEKLPIMDDFYLYMKDVVFKKMKSKDGYECGDDLFVKTNRFDMKGYLMALSAYSKSGMFHFLANNPEPADLLNARFVVFEVDKLSQINDKKFYSICILFIINTFENKMRTDISRGKVMVIEEAWKAIANETMAPYLTSLWKTARKFNTSAYVVTQQMSDINASAVIKDTIIQNSGIRILLDQSNNPYFYQDAEFLGLSEDHKNIILSLNKVKNPFSPKTKEVFIALGDKKCGVYQVEVSDAEAIAYESAKDLKADFLTMGITERSHINAIKKMIDKD